MDFYCDQVLTGQLPVERIAEEAVAWLGQPMVSDNSSCKLSAELIWRGSVRGG